MMNTYSQLFSCFLMYKYNTFKYIFTHIILFYPTKKSYKKVKYVVIYMQFNINPVKESEANF